MADLKIDNLTPLNTNKPDSTQKPQGDFLKAMKNALDSVNEEQKSAENALSDVATGQIKDLHQAAIAIGKAETSMKVMLEMRNKAINAYKEILRTQI